jgi:polysaccharide pyruvyl transferase WcaK-like protein
MRPEAREVLVGLDLFILGGGGILYDSDVDMFLREVFLAHELGVPVMVYAISAGPLLVRSARERVRDALDRTAVLSVRDRPTRQLLEELGVRRDIIVTADPALLLEPEPLTLDDIVRAEAIDPEARLIGFSVREPGPAAPDLDVDSYHRLVANAADFVVDRLDAEVVFFPMEPRGFDVQHSHGVVANMQHAQHATVLKSNYSPGQILTLLAHFQFTIGMRLHFLIFSALAGLPFVALPYASKVTGFLQELGFEAPPFERMSPGRLIAHIDRAWDLREDLRAHIRRALPGLKTRARQNNELALDVLRAGRAAVAADALT